MPSTLVRLSNQVQAEAGSCVSQWFLLCDTQSTALPGGGGVHRYGGRVTERDEGIQRMVGKEEGGR